MPGFAKATLDTMGTALQDNWTHPEAFQSENFRTNLSAAFSSKFDFNANAGFSNTNQRLPQTDNNTFSFIYSALNNPGFNHVSTTGIKYSDRGTLGEFLNGYGGFSPAQTFQVLNEAGTQRFIGSTDATWRPFEWMQNTGIHRSRSLEHRRIRHLPLQRVPELGYAASGHRERVADQPAQLLRRS